MHAHPPIAHFYRLIEQAPPPVRADRSAGGTLPVRAYRYCDAVTTAAGFGWWVFPPTDLQLLWDGHDIFWYCDGLEDWIPLFGSAQFPHQSARFDHAAPPDLQGCSPPFLSALSDPGVVQVWTGLMVRSAPDWSLLVRAPANVPLPGGYTVYEGILESDRRFGPLFTNIRLTRTHVPVRLSTDVPLLQVQPLPRAIYGDDTLNAVAFTPDMAGFAADDDWEDYRTSIVRPSDDPNRTPGGYAIAARKRRKSECPFADLRN
jgi:Family of unknown function (DUF6065)